MIFVKTVVISLLKGSNVVAKQVTLALETLECHMGANTDLHWQADLQSTKMLAPHSSDQIPFALLPVSPTC